MEKLYSFFLSSSGICTDTRDIQKDCLFVALKGANFNGNTFAAEALNQGAKYVVVDEKEYQTDERIVLVDDTLVFLQNLALHHRRQFTIPVIGITGSNGKTTTKELIATVLETKYNTHYTLGNLNNHIGVPLTLLKLKKEHEIAIVEMGANKFKDIEELSSIAEPTHGIITNIGKAHLEGFGGFEGVLKTKKELFESVEKRNGTLICNSDDDVLLGVLPKSTTNYFYSQENDSSLVKGELVSLTPYVKLKWQISGYTSSDVLTNLVGEYNFYNFLAAITFGVLFDVPSEKINAALESYVPSNNRSQVQKTDKNTLIVDCYNANPTSMQSALKSFSMIEHDNKMVVLGDMRELGTEEKLEHEKIIDLLKEYKLKAILVGDVFKNLGTDHTSFSTSDELSQFLSENKLENAMVLLKGSRGIKLEEAIVNL